jgi:hypothetical protein
VGEGWRELETLDARLQRLAKEAVVLPWPFPRVRDERHCYRIARGADLLLVNAARGRGALDVAIGERLAALGVGDRVVVLGYASVGDYSREELGIAASTAQKKARLARELRSRPLLRAAVRTGEVSIRQAEAVLPLARGEDEAFWVERARRDTVRALKKAAKKFTGAEAEEEEEWVCVRLELSAEDRVVVEEAEQLAGKIVGMASPRCERSAALCDEYNGSHEAPGDGGLADALLAAPEAEFQDAQEEWVEEETRRWASLGQPEAIAPLPPLADDADVRRIDRELRILAEHRRRWDEVLGHAAMVFIRIKGWLFLGFASLEQYCEERLGMSLRAVQQRAALERKLYELPSLRTALAERRISYEKARLIARHAEEDAVDEWIGRAEHIPCITLRRELQAEQEAQMCARGEFVIWAPRSVAETLLMTFRAVRKAEKRGLSAGECYARMAEHFIDTWRLAVTPPNTVQQRVLERDKWMCQAPGCSRPVAHVHHIEFRAQGGPDEEWNLISLCAVHHLRGVHMGRLRVIGKAPDQLRWDVIDRRRARLRGATG